MADSPESSKDILIQHALDMFGRRGFDGTGMREIAAAAGKPMSAITYHFGGKQELYLACAQFIASRMEQILSVIGVDRKIKDAGEARARLTLILQTLVMAMLRDEHVAFSRFIMREQQEPTEAFEIIYGGMMGRMLRHMADLLGVIGKGALPPADARVRALTLMGQVVAFRVARAAVLRVNGWDDVGPDELVVIDRAIQANLSAILDDLERRAAQ